MKNFFKNTEPQKETDREYRGRIHGEIAGSVARGEYSGIDVNAQSLVDDVRAWALRGEGRPTNDEIVRFVGWLVDGAKINPSDDEEGRQNFINGAENLLAAIKRRS